MRLRHLAALGVLCLGAAPLLLAQQQAPVFRTRLEVMQVDVSVLDKDRHVVKGLTADDFTVLVEGTVQRIVAFKPFEITETPLPPEGWMRDVQPDVITNDLKESRLFVLVMDDAMVPLWPAFTRDAQKIAESIIEKLGPDDLAAVVFTGDGRKSQDFTTDKTKLRAAVKSFSPGLAGYQFGEKSLNPLEPGVDADIQFYQAAVRTLSNVADYLIAVPNRRKAVFWVSPGVPFDLLETAPKRMVLPDDGGIPPLSRTLDMRDLQEQTQEIFRRAERSNVAIYPIDPTGVEGMQAFLRGRVSPDMAQRKATTQRDFLTLTATRTGGRTVMNTNDYDTGIREVFEENSAYYLIGFEPTESIADGKFRRLEVKVNRPGVEVRTRSGYYADKPDKPSKDKSALSPENAALAKAIGGTLPDGNMPMRITIAPFASPGQKLLAVAIVLGILQPVPPAAIKARITDTTELQTSAFSPEGQPRGTERHTATVVIRQGAEGDAMYEALGRINLKPGKYQLRLATHNPTSGKTGSVFADVIVPDYTKTPFSVSQVMLSHWPPLPSAPEDIFRDLLPLVPTAERVFDRPGQLTAFMRLYQSGQKRVAPVEVTMRVLDPGGQVKFKETKTIEVGEFSTGVPDKTSGLCAADAIFPLQLPQFKPGPYLMTLEATLGETVLRRDVRFSVK